MFGIGMSVDMKLKKSRKKLMGLAYVLETAMFYDDSSKYDVVVDAAVQLRDMLKDEELGLSNTEKVGVVKSITKAKVKAFMSGTPDSYRTFKTLDSISNDLMQLL